MADLDEMLLEAAGRTARNRHSPPSLRMQHKGSYSEDGSDSRDDDSDDDHGYVRKPSGSQIPLKKRLDPIECDNEHNRSSRDEGVEDEDDYDHEGDSDDSVGSDLYKDEEDRQRLGNMSELDREMILAERATKKHDKKLRNSIKKQKEKTFSRKDSPPPTMSKGVRYSARSADRAAAKDGALNELRARQRLRQEDPDNHWKLRDGKGYSPVKRRSFTSTTLNNNSRSDSGSHSEDEESTGDGGMMIHSDDDKTESVLTFEDVKEITIRRSKLAKWVMEPFFDELIIGCFVRIGIGKSKSGSPIYRLSIVRNVDAADRNQQYKLECRTTNKYLNVVWGNESSAARWQMAMVSDSPPVHEEFDQLVMEMERSGGRMPNKQDVVKRKEAIHRINSFIYSAETVKQMLQEKNSNKRRPLNVAAEKDRIRRGIETARMNHNWAEEKRLMAAHEELEASQQVQVKDAKAVRLSEMNRKNRVENFRNASELKPSAGLKAGEAGYDPFSRRWTRSRNYYVAKPGGEEEAAAEANGNEQNATLVDGVQGVEAKNEAGVVATAAALEAAADAGKLVDTRAPVDRGTEFNMLHNFDLPISLVALQKFGGANGVQAGFMARKQRIEATVGCQVPENDGRRHALTLSVSDYKRRRGLL